MLDREESNPDYTENTRNAIWATYYYLSSFDDNAQPNRCPSGPES